MCPLTKPQANPGVAGSAHYSALYGKPSRTSAKRLPAYAKQLIEARQRNIKPWLMLCQFGGNWSLYPDCPKIAIKPIEYQPGMFDFSYLRGLFVVVVVEGGEQQQVLDLCHEIAQQKPVHLLVKDSTGTFPPSDLEGWLPC